MNTNIEKETVVAWLKNQAKIAEDDYEEAIILMIADKFIEEWL